jgi:serine phosphatase RsbU (regulator of sigma subunit)
MPATALPGKVPWYRRRSRSWDALRRLPARSLLRLYLAVFFLFSIFGFFQNLMVPERLPLLVVLFLGVVNGAYSVLYPWILVRHRSPWIWAVMVFHTIFIGLLVHFVVHKGFPHMPGPATSLVVTGQGIWTLLILSYVFFFAFIRNQAIEATRIQNELDLAHSIQQTLVPPIQSVSKLYEIYGITRPSERVGGDLVDLIASTDGDIAYVADVAGHGLQAGILMGMLKAAVRTALLEPANTSERLSLLLNRLDNVLPAVKEKHMYAAFAALQLGASGKVRHALAGHPPLLHYSKELGSFDQLNLEQFPLGLIPGGHFSSSEVSIAPGDLLLIATDGILDTCNAEDREFGNAGLESCVASNAGAPLSQLAGIVLNAVKAWGKQEDDQTLLVVRCLAHE